MFMAKKEDSIVEKAAKKVADAEKKAKQKKPKKDKGKLFPRMWAGLKRFWKDFRGEMKKIIWPDSRSILKNTGIVLGTVLVVGVIIYLIDRGLSLGIRELFELAENVGGEAETTTTVPAAMMQAFRLFF